ncbi:Hydrolase, alpha/beta hydrolase fold protein family [Salipiger mucosus DSM 16094]|uniref:Hydrolase, alpha/beta hydrolase fold protein family n=1 Tax=Salipiger mucosus DSM 16094 TaxID=1123237 RepID=S9QB71_9RHOB|nr:Hydrolase, alpha/beta hydrolase fold protein family [Salipiger mucosus DSM 16094]
MLLPEAMCDARLFGPQIAEFSRERMVVAAPVHLGERIEEVASSLLDGLPRRFALAGMGLGGMVAMELQRRAPDRVLRIMLMGSSPLADTPQQAAERDTLIIKARAGRLSDAVDALLPPDSLAPGPYRAEIQALVQEMAAGLGPEVFVRQVRALQKRRDQQAAMRKLRVPATVLCGAEDTLHPVKRQEVTAELIPGGVLRVIDEAGHLPVLEAPEAVNEALHEWLATPMLLR